MYLLKNVKYYDFKNYDEDVYIVFDEKIRDIGKMSELDKSEYIFDVIDAKGYLLMPSLVVGHTHIYSTLSRGLSLPFNPTNFEELLKQLWWRIDGQLDKEDIYYSGIVSGIDYVKNGVTTIVDHHASGMMIEGSLDVLKKAIVDDIDLRGIFCFETSDRFDVKACINENVNFINQDYPNAKGLFGAHALLSLSEESLELMKIAIEKNSLHIHVAESIDDQELCEKLYGERVVERLDRHGLLNENSILSHCIHINEEEINLIKERGCVVAVNVTSNMNNAVGLPDIVKLKEAGIPLIIGNDGIAPSITTEWTNILFSMHHRYQSPIGFGFDYLLEMIEDTYKYVNKMLDVKLGKIEVGYDSDLLLIPYHPPTSLNKDNGLGHMIFGLASSFKPKHVFCKGNYIVKDYEVNDVLQEKYHKAVEQSEILWKKIQENEVK